LCTASSSSKRLTECGGGLGARPRYGGGDETAGVGEESRRRRRGGRYIQREPSEREGPLTRLLDAGVEDESCLATFLQEEEEEEESLFRG